MQSSTESSREAYYLFMQAEMKVIVVVASFSLPGMRKDSFLHLPCIRLPLPSDPYGSAGFIGKSVFSIGFRFCSKLKPKI
jgi:hypothetical protein